MMVERGINIALLQYFCNTRFKVGRYRIRVMSDVRHSAIVNPALI